MTGPAVSIIIINYNGGAFLQAAVDSLSRQTFRDFELIVFDNASSDGSAESLNLSALPAARLVCNPENLGFAGGNNRAADFAGGKWLVLLNPDTVAAPDWLQQLMAAAAAHPGCRTFASAQLDLADPGLMDGAGDAYLIFGMPWRGGFARPASDLPGPGWCFSACGAAAMYDLALFREMGGFDERYFCYCEDVDLGFRMQLMGHDCRFVPEAIVHHAGSGITGRLSEFATFHGTRNRIWTYFKNMPASLIVLTLPGHLLLTAYVLMTNFLTPRRRPMLRGLKQGFGGALRVRRDARWRVKPRQAGLWSLIRRMAWNPFRMQARKAHVRADS